MESLKPDDDSSRPAGSEADIDVLVVGAGITGIYQLYLAREAGFSVRLLEAGGGVGGHLVLEPLSRGTIRLRELHLRLPVLAGTVRRVGMAGALLGTAGDRALSELRGRSVRATRPHTIRHQGHIGRLLRVVGNVDGSGRWRHRSPDSLPHRRDRHPLGAVFPGRARAGGLPRPVAPYGTVADGAGCVRRQACRRDRYRIERCATDPRGRRRGGIADGVPTHRQLVHAPQQLADHAGRAGATQGWLRSDA